MSGFEPKPVIATQVRFMKNLLSELLFESRVVRVSAAKQ